MPKQRDPVVTVGERWSTLDLAELPWVVEVVLDLVDGAPQLLGLRLDPRSKEKLPIGDRVITAERLRALPLGRIKAMVVAAETLDLVALGQLMTTRNERLPGQPWPIEHYEQVARVYERAIAAGRPPLPAIQEVWNVSRPSAAKYVKRAREIGFLGYPERIGVAGTGSKNSPHIKRAPRRKR